jgi:cell division protein FtsI (penicillin-binding protein 3)
MATVQQGQTQNEVFNQRLPVVVVVMVIASVYLLLKMFGFQQLPSDVINELSPDYDSTIKLAAARGIIYDREGQRLAVNTLEYRVGISPNLVSNPQKVATQLSSLLNLDELETFQIVSSEEPYALLAPRVNAEIGQQVEALGLDNVLLIDKIPRRIYPQGTLAAQILGFVGGDLQGYYGVEGKFQDQLAGRPREEIVSAIPFEVTDQQEADKGNDIYLTLDRDIQFLIESELQRSITETSATGGTIIVMNPRTGDILGMASWPSFDPNDFQSSRESTWRNPAVSEQYEPGSIMKVLTVAGALDNGTIQPQWTYNDQGRLEVGGITVENWDRKAHGVVDTQGILVQSLNVGAATISLQMGPNDFFKYLSKFNMGRLTGVNLEGEAAGTMFIPGDQNYSDSNLGANAYGQGIAATPLQMITAISAIANDGLMMQPNIVQKIVAGGQTIPSQPTALGRPIKAETAHIVRDMMIAVVRDGLDSDAQLAGYTVAGKTGTAEIPGVLKYRDDAWIMSFVGFLPADDPQVIVLIKLDEPKTGRWASQVVAPIFRRLAERLVIYMEIPSDDVRLALQGQGGNVNDIQR